MSDVLHKATQKPGRSLVKAISSLGINAYDDETTLRNNIFEKVKKSYGKKWQGRHL